jgi:hypothetical protein
MVWLYTGIERDFRLLIFTILLRKMCVVGLTKKKFGISVSISGFQLNDLIIWIN